MSDVLQVWNPSRHGDVASLDDTKALIERLVDTRESEVDPKLDQWMTAMAEMFPTPSMLEATGEYGGDSVWGVESFAAFGADPTAALGVAPRGDDSERAIVALIDKAWELGLAVWSPSLQAVWLAGDRSYPAEAEQMLEQSRAACEVTVEKKPTKAAINKRVKTELFPIFLKAGFELEPDRIFELGLLKRKVELGVQEVCLWPEKISARLVPGTEWVLKAMVTVYSPLKLAYEKALGIEQGGSKGQIWFSYLAEITPELTRGYARELPISKEAYWHRIDHAFRERILPLLDNLKDPNGMHREYLVRIENDVKVPPKNCLILSHSLSEKTFDYIAEKQRAHIEFLFGDVRTEEDKRDKQRGFEGIDKLRHLAPITLEQLDS